MKDKHIINSFKDLRKAIEEVTASQPAKSRQELQKEKMKPLKEGVSVSDERIVNKGKGIIIMIDDNGKKVSAIFKNKKNADKYNRNKASDLKALLDLAKNTPYPKAIDESEEVNEAKTVSYDDAFAELTDSSHDYEVNYRSHTDIQEFIDFLRSYYPKGTKFE